MAITTEFERAVEKSIGETVESIRQTPLEERRQNTEKKFKRQTRFYSLFPFIGRGNVLRDYIFSHDRVEAELDEALR